MPGILSDIFGSKPTVPPLQPLSLETEQQKAITGNLAALPATEKLVGQANIFNTQQIQQMLQQVIPNYNAITGTATTDIASMLKGEIPTDVSQQIQTSAAARALGGGFAGSGMQRDLVARDLGLTSLDLMQKGISSAESWVSMMDKIYAPGQMDVSKMFITPAQQATFDVEERNLQFQRQWLQSQIGAMPDPVLGGIYQNIKDAGEAFLSSYCWVARAAYGEANPRWRLFRRWLLTKAPTWLRQLYGEEGERFAAFIRNKPRLKAVVRWLMDKAIIQPKGSTHVHL